MEKHLDLDEILLLANKGYVKSELVRIGKYYLIDSLVSDLEKHVKGCKNCKHKIDKPRKPVNISQEDWLSLK